MFLMSSFHPQTTNASDAEASPVTVFVSYAVSSSAVPPASVPLPLPAAPSDDEPHAVNIDATIVVQSNAHNTFFFIFCPPSFMPYWRYITTALLAIY